MIPVELPLRLFQKRIRLNHELLDKLVVLRMNLKFMIHCQGKNGHVGKVKKVRNEVGNDEDLFTND